MYAFDDMVDLGLKENQKWPHDDYRIVAMNCALCNPNINTRDKLVEVIQTVLKVPKKEIRKVTKEDLIEKYGCSNYWFY